MGSCFDDSEMIRKSACLNGYQPSCSDKRGLAGFNLSLEMARSEAKARGPGEGSSCPMVVTSAIER